MDGEAIPESEIEREFEQQERKSKLEAELAALRQGTF